jgi:cysteinyl-tRNA synthetase
MALNVYNTLTRTLEPFVPLDPPRVGMYVCGPTVYGHSHLGHAKSYVSFDVIYRYLRHLGYRVLYVQNITDVGHLVGDADEGEDKILRQSRQDRIHPMELVETYTRSYFEDMDRLGVIRPAISPRATGHITEQISLVENLLAKDLAYEANGSVYFSVASFAAYGKLSRRTVDELAAGARVEVKSEKRHPADFALWKKADPGHLMRWPSPWGEGFPGWHLECSAMAMKYLGESIDIHGGGLENQFPHHECEIAQSEGATGKPFVRYWLHNNMVTVDGRKMGKSLGNFLTLKDAFTKWDPLVVRFFILQSHYRGTLDFSDAAVEGAARGFEKLANAVRNLRDALRSAPEEGPPAALDLDAHRAAFLATMDDDFNTPKAIAVLFDVAREVNLALTATPRPARASLALITGFFEEFGGSILGLLPATDAPGSATHADLTPALADLFIAIRAEVRAQKLWKLSDAIRDGLAKTGIVLEDKKDGTTWKRSS